MLRNILVPLVSLALAFTAVGTAVAEPSPSSPGAETAQIEFQHISARDAMTALRSIVGLRSLQVVSDREIKADGSAEELALVRAVVGMVDVAKGQQPVMESLEVESDRSMIARLMLQPAKAPEAMQILRKKVSAKHVAAMQNPELIVFRDSPEKIEAGLKLLESMVAASE
ncbi:MAG: hypothetical protein AAGM22_05295 [Acidobacteriota bacterium]